MNNDTLCGIRAFRLPQTLLFLLVTGFAMTMPGTVARGQEIPGLPVATPTPSVEASPVATPGPTPIPLSETVAQAEAATANLRTIEAEWASDQISASVAAELPALVREIDARLEENQKILNSRPSLETLRNLDTEWKALANKLFAWRRDLTTRATGIEREIARLRQLDQIWSNTLAQAQNTGTTPGQDPAAPAQSVAPPEILQRIQTVIAAIKQTLNVVEKQSTQILTLQNRVAEQDARIAAAIAAVKQVREETINRLFVKDSPAIWSAELWSRDGQSLLQDSQNSFNTQLNTLGAYARQHSARFILHVLLFLLLVGAVYWARYRVRPLVAAEPTLEGVARVFSVPIATALVLSVLISGWVYPQLPRMLGAILGAAALIPTIIILRRLVERRLFPFLNALVGFYFMDLLRTISTALPLASRLLFLAEMLGGLLFLAWLIRSERLAGPKAENNWLWTVLRIGSRIAGGVFLAAFIANSLGYVSIAGLVGDALLGSAYVAVILYAAVRIADGVIMFAMRIRPLSLLGMVRQHRRLLRRRVQRLLRWIAVLVWAFYTLELSSLRAPVIEQIRAAITAKLEVGQLSLSLSNIIAFVVTVWLSFLLSRFLLFLLEEDIYPRIDLARGVPYAVSTVLHYTILLVGFFFAVAAMGIDMTKFTILAGAFGVGLGFGLQNIVNNFVSGLILLFERPVHVGDMIQVGSREGRLRRIGMRASVIRTLEGSEVIVPNGQLISEEVLNWTLSDQQRRIEITVGVAYGTDPERVIKLLTEVGAKHPDIIDDPGAETLFLGFGDNSLDFQLRAWTIHFKKWPAIRSELTIGINAALRDAGISIPFPQRDLYIKSVPSDSSMLRAADTARPESSPDLNRKTAGATEK